MKTAVIYARYSSDKQTEQSIEGQLRVCNEYAERNNILVVDKYIDRAMTGTNDNRDDFQKMLKDSSKRAWDYVLVYKLDRFARNKYESVIHKKTLKDNGVKVLSAMENIPDSPEGSLMETLLEGFNQYFSEELAQKVKRGMNENRQKGLFTGGRVPYGYKVENKKVFVDEDRANIVREIYENYAAGICVKNIIEDLTNRGILYNNKPFARNTVYKILKNEKYFGVFRHGNETFTNIYPQIIPNDVFVMVRKKVEENHYGKHVEDIVYLLKNKLVCGYCGKTIQSECGTSKNGSSRRYYKCSGRKYKTSNCTKNAIRKELLENLVVNTTIKIFDNAKTIDDLVEKLLELHKKREEENSTINILTQEKNRLTKSIENLIDCMEKGITTNSTKSRLEKLEEQLSTTENLLAIERTKEKLVVTKADIIKFLKSSLKKEPRQMISLLIKKIILFDDKIEIYYNYVDNNKRPDDDHLAFSFYEYSVESWINETKFKHNGYLLKTKICAFI